MGVARSHQRPVLRGRPRDRGPQRRAPGEVRGRRLGGAGHGGIVPATSGSRPRHCGWCCRREVPAETFESVRAVGSGTAPLPPELAEEFEDRYGIPVLGTYGATEFAGAIAGWTLKDKKQWGPRKRGSVGRAHHGIELRIVDPETGGVLAGRGDRPARGARQPVARRRGRLAADHRPRRDRRRRVPVHPRPGGRRDQPRRVQDPAQRDRGSAGSRTRPSTRRRPSACRTRGWARCPRRR